jgi:hypothetical protein
MMNSRIKYKLTIKVPNTKLLADYYFHTKNGLESFVKLNEIKPFDIRPAIIAPQHLLIQFRNDPLGVFCDDQLFVGWDSHHGNF